jgi:hypothetical protein
MALLVSDPPVEEELYSNRRPLGEKHYLTEFVTPGTYLVKQLVPSLQTAFRKDMIYNCFDWVCRHIRYCSEWGDVWYFPAEAIHMGRGDCEESSFIACSLLRACGLSPDEIFVAVGNYGRSGHAWCALLDSGKYWVLETTLSEAPNSVPLQAQPYEPYILFNDVHSIELRSGFVLAKTNQKEKVRQIEEFYGIMVG